MLPLRTTAHARAPRSIYFAHKLFWCALWAASPAFANPSSAPKKAPTLPAAPSVSAPWTLDEVKQSLHPGAAFLYRQEASEGIGVSVSYVKREVIATTDKLFLRVTSLDAKQSPNSAPDDNPVEWSDYMARLVSINGHTTARKETLKTPAGTFKCVVLKTKSEPDGKASTVMWLAKDHPGLVVKSISEVGKMKRVMTLEAYSP